MIRETQRAERNTQYARRIVGFTLIELLVAMTIMAVLMGIALVSYQGARRAARDGKRKADLEQIRSALEIYRNDCAAYPLTLGTSLVGVNVPPVPPEPPSACLTTDIYLQEVPTDPLSPTKKYGYIGAVNSYVLCASLENPVAGADITGCVSCGVGEVCNYKVINP